MTAGPLDFRDPARARALVEALARSVDALGRPAAVMHVCGTHEQAIARFGLRAKFPAGLDVIMGPGCPVCITDAPEVDEAIALARRGVRVLTYGDMLRVPGTSESLADARSAGACVDAVYSVAQAVEIAEATRGEVVFFATGFETTAVATAAVLLAGVPANLSVLSAHKYILPAMEAVAAMPGTRIEGFLAAGHAATITGSAIFEPFAARHAVPVVVAGFEPLDIVAALVRVVNMIRAGERRVVNMFPRCVTRNGNRNALRQLWQVFEPVGGRWRGIAHIPDGNLRLRDEWAHVDARHRFASELAQRADAEESTLSQQCICGNIMSGMSSPRDCSLFGGRCVPDSPVGACMVSSEGACRIWHEYGGVPSFGGAVCPLL